MIVRSKDYNKYAYKDELQELHKALEQTKAIVTKLNKENNNLKTTVEKLSAALGQEKKKSKT
jgi:regulator of replication initiation timing